MSEPLSPIEALEAEKRRWEAEKKLRNYKTSIPVEGVGVDAGMIAFASKSVFETFDPKAEFDETLTKIIDVPPGLYEVKYDMPDTWNGECKGKGYLNIPDGKLIISDPCYIIGHAHDEEGDDLWHKFCDETCCGFLPLYNMMTCCEMGGDGCYNMQIDLQRIDL